MSFRMDMSKFKKVSSDKNHTILKHDDGHEIKIAHNALQKHYRKQLEKIPNLYDGGEVDTDASIIAKKAKVDEYNKTHEDEPKEYPQEVETTLQKTDITPKQKLAEGGEAKSEESTPVPLPPGYTQPNPGENTKFGETLSDLGSNIVSSFKNLGNALSSGIKGEGVPSTPPAETQPAAAPMSAAAPMQAEQPPVVQPAPAPTQQPPMPATTPSNDPSIMGGYQKEQSGIEKEAQAQGALGQEQAETLKHQVASAAKIASDYQDHFNAVDTERKAFQKDILDGHIDPNRFLGSQDTGGKIATAISLVLGGLGSGITGGPNQALEFLNRQIDNDIQAQRADLGKKENLLSTTMRQFGNIKDATEMAKIMMTDMTQAQLAQQAAKSQSPLAKANALKLSGELEQKVVPLVQQQSLRSMLMSGQQQSSSPDEAMQNRLNVLRVLAPEKAKEEEQRYVPGVGSASIPVPKEVRDSLVAKQTLSERANDFYQWASQHSGSLNPSDVNVGRTKAAELQSLYRNAINGGVFKKGEQEFIDNIIDSDPTKFFNSIRVLPKLKEVIRSNDSQLNTLKKGYGLPTSQGQQNEGPQLSQQQQSFVNWAKANPNDPRSAIVLKKLGL